MPTEARQFLFSDFSGGLTTAPLRSPVGTYRNESNVSTDVAGEVSQQPESLEESQKIAGRENGATLFVTTNDDRLFWFRVSRLGGVNKFVEEELLSASNPFRFTRTTTRTTTIAGNPEPRGFYYSSVLDTEIISADGFIAAVTDVSGAPTAVLPNDFDLTQTVDASPYIIAKGTGLAFTGAFDADGRVYIYNSGKVGVPFVAEITKLEDGSISYRKLFEFPRDEEIVAHTVHGDYAYFYTVSSFPQAFKTRRTPENLRQRMTSKVYYWNRARYISIGSDTATTYDNFTIIEGEIVSVGYHRGAGWMVVNQFGKFILGYVSGQSFVPVRDIFLGIENYGNVHIGMDAMISFGNDLLFAITHDDEVERADETEKQIVCNIYSYGNGVLKKFRSFEGKIDADENFNPLFISRFLTYSPNSGTYHLLALGNRFPKDVHFTGDNEIDLYNEIVASSSSGDVPSTIIYIRQKYNNEHSFTAEGLKYSNGYIDTPIITIENPAMTIVPKRMALHGYIRDVIAFDKKFPEYAGAIKVQVGINTASEPLVPVLYTFKNGIDNLVEHKDDFFRQETLDPSHDIFLFASRETVTEQADKTLAIPTTFDRFRCFTRNTGEDLHIIYNQQDGAGSTVIYATAETAQLFTGATAKVVDDLGDETALTLSIDSTTPVPYTINRQQLVTIKLGQVLAPDDKLFIESDNILMYTIPISEGLYPLNRPIDVRGMFAGLSNEEQVTSLFFRISLEQSDAFLTRTIAQSAVLRSFWFEYEQKEYL